MIRSTTSRRLTRRAMTTATAIIAIVGLAACAGAPTATSPIRLGWAGEVPPLDPAASDSAGSFALLSQVYPSLLTVEGGTATPLPDIAASAEWTADGVYTVVLKTGLRFANGDALTSSDVKFSIERQLALQSEDGAWRQLANLDSVEIVDDTTIEFHLGTAVDTSFPFVLAGPAGLVLDEEAFFADELTPDVDIIEAEAFAGPFSLTAARGDVLTLTPYGSYAGVRTASATVEVHLGADDDLGRQLSDGTIDVITGRLGADNIQSLSDDEMVELSRAASGRVRLLAFDFPHMPFGTRTETPDAAKATAVRAAIADIVDRAALARSIGVNVVRPLYGYLPDGVPGAADVFSATTGDLDGGPDVDRAEAALVAAGIIEPVELSIHVDLGEVGDPGSAEVAGLAEQLDDSGLFAVTVVETDAADLGTAMIAGDVQAVFTSIMPTDFDPQGYLVPFRSAGSTAQGFSDSNVDALLARQITELDPAVREATVLETQNALATLLPAIPITQGVRVVFARPAISGTRLDDSFALDLSQLRR